MQYRDFFENSADAMLVIEEGEFIACNAAAVAMLGYDRKEEVLHTPPACLSPEFQPDGRASAEKAAAMIAQAIEQGNLRFEWDHIRKDGTVFPVEVSLVAVEEAGTMQLHTVWRDITDRKRIDRALRESERDYKAIFNASSEAVFIHDAETKMLLAVNAGMLKMYGFDTEEEVLSLSAGDLSADSPDFSAELAGELIQRVFVEGAQIFEWLSKRKDQSTFWTEVSLTAIKTSGRKKVQAVVRDISERKRAEIALRESEERYRLLIDNQMDLVVKVDLEGRFLFVSPSYCKMFGKTEDELLGHAFMPLVHEDDRAETERAMADLLKPPHSFYLEQRAMTKAGWRWLAWQDSAVLDDAGDVVAVIGVGRDITERKRAILERRESSERLTLATQAAHMGIWDYDLQNDVLIWDKQMFVLYGVDPADFDGHFESWRKTLHRGDVERVEEEFRRFIENDVPFESDFRVVWPDGSIHYLRVQAMVQRDAAGAVTRVVGTNWEITQQKEMVGALRQSERNYRLLFENMTTGFVLFEIEGGATSGVPTAFRFVEANPAAEEMLGMSQGKLVGQTMRGLFTQLEDHWFDVFAKVAMTGIPSAYEDRMEALGRVFEAWIFVPKAGTLAVVFSDTTARRTAEQAVLRAQRQLQLIVNNTKDVIFQIDLKGNYIYSNAAVEEMSGYRVDEVLTMNMMEMVAPEYQTLLADRLRQRLDGKLEEGSFSFEIVHKKGNRIWVDLSTNGVFDPDGKMVAIQGIARDITQQKRVDLLISSLVETGSTKFGQNFFEAMVVELGRALDADFTMIGEFKPDGGGRIKSLAYCSAGTMLENVEYGLAGTPCNEVLEGRVCLYSSGVSTLFPNDALLTREAINAYVGIPLFNAQREPIGIMIALFRQPLADATFSKSVLQAFSGRTGAEIERKRREAELQRLSTAIDQTADAVVVTSPEGVIEYVNPAFEITTGYSQEEVLGQTPRILKSGEHSEAFYTEMWAILAAGKVWQGRMVNRRKDGSLYTEEATLSPVHDASGRIVHHVAVKRDITKVLELEERYRQSHQMESIGRLAGGVAHDFNNILQSILGFGGMLVSELEEGTPPHNDAEEILKAARRAAALTRKLLTFSQQQSVGHAELDLNELVASNERMLRRLIGREIHFVTRLHTPLRLIRGDATQIERILLNLFVNARDAMPDGGTLEVATAEVALADRPGEFACLSVSDTGCGMADDVRANLFEPFFTTKPIGHGTGLGLSVVYGIAQQHGGWIDFSSELGKGSVFKVYLPLRGEGRLDLEASA